MLAHNTSLLELHCLTLSNGTLRLCWGLLFRGQLYNYRFRQDTAQMFCASKVAVVACWANSSLTAWSSPHCSPVLLSPYLAPWSPSGSRIPLHCPHLVFNSPKSQLKWLLLGVSLYYLIVTSFIRTRIPVTDNGFCQPPASPPAPPK